MYDIFKIFSSTFREQAFSNPFEYVTNDPFLAILLFAFLGITMLKEIPFKMCGIFYKRGSNKLLGSFGYFVFYCINIYVLTKLCQWTQNLYLVISLYIVFVVVMFILLHKVKNVKRQNII